MPSFHINVTALKTPNNAWFEGNCFRGANSWSGWDKLANENAVFTGVVPLVFEVCLSHAFIGQNQEENFLMGKNYDGGTMQDPNLGV